MIDIAHLLAVADAFMEATSVKEVTLSHRLFADSKKLTAMREGADITVGRFNAAFMWLDANWPQGAVWPSDIPRPSTSERFDRMVQTVGEVAA